MTNVVAGVLLICAGYSFRESGETVVITRVDTVPYAAFRDSLEGYRLESAGLRATLAGRDNSTPRAILRTDTFVTPPDTVLQLVRVTGSILSIAPLIRRDSLWAPEIHSFDVGRCDDGFSWAAGQLVCDRARFGHMSLYATLGVTGDPFGPMLSPALNTEAGIQWTPSHRSPWRSFLAIRSNGSVGIGVTRLLPIW